jgi:hypothetical protein
MFNIIILLFLLIICLIFFICKTIKNISYKETIFKMSNNCKYILTPNVREVLENNNITEITDNKNDYKTIIHIPCTYDNPSTEINNMDINPKKNNYIFILENPDDIVAKEYLWQNLLEYYGLEQTLKLVPMTYVLENNNDLKLLENNHDKSKLFILKKNVQRQEGIKITNDINEILENKNEYKLAQELIQNPYLIKGRKINLRVYVLVVCKKDDYKVYMYNDGFMYYTKELFKKNSINNDNNITTGYVDRWIYDTHPLTHEDFKKYLDSNKNINKYEIKVKSKGNKISDYIFNNIRNLVKNVFIAFYKKIGNGNILYNTTSFQLFGLDVAINDDLSAILMEVNKGPDVGSKDERDGKLKKGLLKDILKTINIIKNDKDNGFIEII